MPRKQKDGRYRTKIVIGHTADGKPLVKWAQGKTKAELEADKAAIRAHYIDGAINRADVVFYEYAAKWYKTRKETHVSRGSAKNYRSYLNNHILPAFGARMLRSITATDIQTWLNGYEGKSDSLIIYILAALRGIYKGLA